MEKSKVQIEQYDRDISLSALSWFPYSSRIDHYLLFYISLFEYDYDQFMFFG